MKQVLIICLAMLLLMSVTGCAALEQALEYTEPTEAVTEPEVTTEPEPTEEPEPVPEEPSASALMLVAVLCALAGAAVGAGVVILVQKKKQSVPQTEEK